jgi:N-acetylmuramoyl-L-alanine amidase
LGFFSVVLALLLFAGCSSAPESGPGSSAQAIWSAKPIATKPVVTNAPPPHVTAPPLIIPINVPPVIHPSVATNLPAIKNNTTNAIVAAPIIWTSLTRWAAEQKIDPPRRISTSPVVCYAVATTNGVMVLTIGSRETTWRGTEFHLGFAPEIIDNQVFVHVLDLEKNIEPLLRGAAPVYPNRVIVLDPGHGGAQGGALSVLDNRPEKEFTLDLARRLKRLLEAEHWQVFLTRTNDADVALSNRVSFAESHHADLFISLHFNSAAPDRRQSGLETFCLTPTGMPSTLTRGYPDILTDRYPNNEFDARNFQLAMRVHKAALRSSGEEDRGVRRARFLGVLRGEKRPAILIEGGYLSNPHEAERIENPDFRQALAEGIATALK